MHNWHINKEEVGKKVKNKGSCQQKPKENIYKSQFTGKKPETKTKTNT
jgi:hypothetical protein